LVIGRDEAGLTGFCAWDANRAAWLGPIAVRPGERGRGLGTPLLLGALHQMASVGGYTSAEIGWVGPIAFYVKKAGARLGRTFLTYRKDLTGG
jgi:mycothiol synthase